MIALDTANARCTQTRIEAYTAELNLLAYNSTLPAFESRKSQIKNEILSLQAPSQQTCNSEENLIKQWEERLSQAQKDLDGHSKAL